METKQIKIKTPAKINLTLEVLDKREDGFHNIQSVMQMVDLYDYLVITIRENDEQELTVSGTSDEIPYDETNLVYKAAKLFFYYLANCEDSYFEEQKHKVHIHIEKNIPISAGLAGGSTNAAGTLYGLNRLFNDILSTEGEKVERLPFKENSVSLIKPKKLGISAKEAYTKYSEMENKPNYDMTHKLIDSLKIGTDLNQFLYNDLETAIFNDYKEFQYIKSKYPKAVMSGSGSTYFILNNDFEKEDGYDVINGLKFICSGVEEE